MIAEHQDTRHTRYRRGPSLSGQGLVEFALILPLLLLMMVGVIEFGRMLAIYNGVSNSAREAARWGSVVGVAPSGKHYYEDCAGMAAAANRTATLINLDSVEITYEKPAPNPDLNSPQFTSIGACINNVATTTEPMQNGYRVSITTKASFAPILPFVPIAARTFTFVAARTVFTTIVGAPACNDDADNDNDGKTDYSPVPGLGDPDCASSDDATEQTEYTSTNCYTLTIIPLDSSNGNTALSADYVAVSPASSTGCAPGSYNYNTTVTLTAVNKNGKSLDHWSSNVNSADKKANPDSVTLKGSTSVFAYFISVDCYTLTITQPGSGGVIEYSPGSNCDGGKYNKGTQVLLTANATGGFMFDHWSDGSTVNPLPVTMDSDKSFTAEFILASSCSYRLTTSAQPNNSGTIGITPGECAGGNKYMGTVTLTALPATNYVFSSWSGDYSSTANPLYVSMSSNKSVTANFVRCYQVLYFADPTKGTVSIYPQSTGGCPGLSYAGGTSVTLIATGNQGYTFNGWTGTQTSGSATLKIINISSDQDVTANFVPADTATCRSLGLSVQPYQPDNDYVGGSIVASPSPKCADNTKYQLNTDVQLTAGTNNGFTFSHWSIDGADAGSSTTLKVKMDADKTVVANFTPQCYTLTLPAVPNGAVSRSSPASTNCTTGNGAPGLSFNTSITLRAEPDMGYGLLSWDGLPGNTVYDYNNNTATFLIKNDTTATATFSSECFSLTTSVGSGQGSVNQPAGTCADGKYPAGSVVTIEGVGDAGYGFLKWTDSNGADLPDGANPSLAAVMNGNKTYVAHFAQCYTLTPNTSPVGAGTITRDKNPDCQGGTRFTAGTVVTLTANNPADGAYLFSSWSTGATSAVIQVTINADTTVTANYDPQCFTLTRLVQPDTTSTPPVSSAGGTIGVTVVSGPNAPACPNAGEYRAGTQLTLAANHNPGYRFSKWVDTGSTSATRDLTISSNVTVTARFNAICPIASVITGTSTTIQLTLTNYTGALQTIGQIALTWPAGGESNKFKQIDFGTSAIWSSSGGVSSGHSNITTTINGGWKDTAVRTFSDAVARPLTFYFQGFSANGAGKSYTVVVTFANGCEVSASKTFP